MRIKQRSRFDGSIFDSSRILLQLRQSSNSTTSEHLAKGVNRLTPFLWPAVAVVAASAKVQRTYTGPLDAGAALNRVLTTCDPQGPLIMHAVKLYPAARDTDAEEGSGAVASSFWTLCRVYSGTVRPAATASQRRRWEFRGDRRERSFRGSLTKK